jgi:hypothetical protein
VTTASDLITDAMYASGIAGQDQSISNADMQLGLRIFQRMVDSWSNDTLTVYNTTSGTITLVSGTRSYSTTLLSSGRPVTIQNAFLSRGTVDYPLEQISEQSYNDIAYKTATGIPSVFFFDPSFANGTFYFYPVPSAADTVTVNGRFPLATSLALTTAISLPPGYEQVLVSNLAVELCPFFGTSPSQALMRSATMSRDVLKATNYTPGVLNTGLPGTGYSQPGYIRILGDT